MIFNKNILRLHREFAIQNLHYSDFLIEHAACEIIENIELLNIPDPTLNNTRSQAQSLFLVGEQCSDDVGLIVESDIIPQNILELGGRAGHLSRKLSSYFPSSKLTVIEDEEQIDFLPDSFDLITSCMNFHWVNEAEKTLRNLSKILTDDGKLVMNFISSGSLSNLAKFLIECEIEAGVGHRPHIIPLPKEEKVQTIFQQTGFKFVVVSTEKIELEYQSPITLMKDLKNMGENNALSSGIGILPRIVLTHHHAQKTPFLDVVNLITVVAGKK